MKRNNILAKKRLMRTRTHILTLLIAATMILSSAVTMASVNENTIIVEEDITNPAPASVGEFDGAFSPPSPELNIVEDRLNRYNSYSKADVVWDNDMSYIGMGASHQCSAYDAKAADDFMFSEDTGVGGVQWVGGHWNGDPIPSDWGIEFFEDDGTGTAPGAMIAGPYIFEDSEITKIEISVTPGGSSYYDYTVLLPGGVQCDAGERYWVAIYGASEYPPQSGFAYHDTIIGAEASWMSIYFSVPDWTPQGRDHAFKLYGVDTDVFVSDIIAPNDLSAFCPCTPVEVEVTNIGQAEQTFPVDVEIRRNLMCEGFEAPPAPPAWPPTDPMFGPWTLVNGGEGSATWQSVPWPTLTWGSGILGAGFPSTAISGDFAYANSDAAPSSEWMIEDLITPALPPGSGAPYLVEFDYEIYGFGEDITVMVAPTFGGPWIPVGVVGGGPGYNAGHFAMDIFPIIAGYPAVYVSWTYNDYDSWGYDAAMDNVMIFDLGAGWMVFETFTPIVPPSFPPAGWTETSYGGGDWDQVTSETAYPFRAIPIDNAMAEFMSGLMTGDSLLETMAFDFTDACNPMVSFYMWHDTYGSDDYLEILVDDGSGWVGTGDTFSRLCCPGCPDGWIEHIIDLSAYAGVNGVTIGFYGVGDANPGAYNLQIDDVCVYDQEYYEEMEVTVPGASTINVEFPEWCICNWNDPAWADTYEDVVVIASTHLDIDEVPSNDAMIEDVTVYIPFEHDIASISIDEPVDTVPVSTFEMCGTIKNVGQYEECCFSVYMTVQEVVFGSPVTLFTEDFNSGTPYTAPAGWTIDPPVTNWRTYYNFYAGGSPPYELQYYWSPSVVGTYRCISPAINTVGMPEVELTFEHYLSHFSGPYTLSVETSTTGLPGSFTPVPGLTWVNPTGWPATHQVETITQDVGATLYISFTFDGVPYNLNYWDIDDVIVTGRTMSFLPPEWEDDFCIDDIEVCEEVQICFDDWTPATPWPDCGTKTYRICMETAMCDPPDQNPINDIVCDYLTVEFWRDVSVDITSPAKRADTFYAVDAGLDNFVSFDPLIPGTYTVISSSGFTAFPQGACFVDTVMWTCDTNGLIYTRDEGTGTMTLVGASGAAGGLVALAYDDSTGTLYGASTTALHTINMGTGVATLVGAYGGAVISLMISIDCDLAGNMYGLELGFSGAGALHSIDTATGICTKIANTGLSLNYGQDISYDKDNNILYGTLFNYDTFQGEFYTIDTTTAVPTLVGVLDGGAQTTCLAIPYTGSGTPPPPPVDIWVTCGEQDFCATFENLGTFDEPGCIIDWAIYEWDGGPVYLDGGSETIDLGVGEVVEDYCFGSYDFDEDGVYILEVEIIAPVMDCYLDNNEDDLVIGVDCCPPETTFVLDPEQPNGENNWYTSSVTVTIDAVDCCDPPYIGSGVDEIRYKINGVAGSISGDHGTISVSDNGVHLIEIWAVDNAGNEEGDHHTFEVAIDAGDPSVGLIYEAYEEDDGWHVDFTASVSDDTSGIEKVEFYIGSSLEGTLTEAPFVWSIAWEDGYESEDFKATAYDKAGNSASDTVDGSIIEAIPHSFQAQAVPVLLVQQQANPLVRL